MAVASAVAAAEVAEVLLVVANLVMAMAEVMAVAWMAVSAVAATTEGVMVTGQQQREPAQAMPSFPRRWMQRR